MVLVVGIDLIEIVALAKDVLRRQQTCLDRVVRIVVSERPVATNDLKIVELADKRSDLGKRLLIANDIGRVCARCAR